MKPLQSQPLRFAALAGLLAMAALAPAAQASVVIGNYSSTNASAGTIITAAAPGTTIKAAGFQMNAGTDFALDSVKLQLKLIGAAANPVVAIYGDSGLSSPGSLLATLVAPVFGSIGVDIDAIFTSASPFTLLADTAYWLVVQNVGSDSLQWGVNGPNITPTGASATNLGYRFGNDGTAATNISAGFNSYEISGTAVGTVPEPMSLALVAAALLAAGVASRRRA